MLPPTFTGLAQAQLVYRWEDRTTNSDVLSTALTVRLFSDPRGPLQRGKSAAHLRNARKGGLGNQQFAFRVPTSTSALPQAAFRVKNRRRVRRMVQERDEFMKALEEERNARFELEEWAATKLQRIARGFLVRPRGPNATNQQEDQDLTKESLKTQVARMAAQTKKQMELGELSHSLGRNDVTSWRVKAERSALRKERKKRLRAIEQVATTLFQALTRGFLVRRAVRAMRTRHLLQKQQSACLVIQCAWRCNRARRTLHSGLGRRLNSAAEEIQRTMRGAAGRRRATAALANRLLQEQMGGGATKFQALYRGYRSRLRVSAIHLEQASIKLQGAFRSHRVRCKRYRERQERAHAARKIQSQFRGLNQRKHTARYRQRQREKKEAESATRIQACFRGNHGRKLAMAEEAALREKHDAAATKIQAACRRREAKQKVALLAEERKEHRSALKIQSLHRGKKARKYAKEKRAKARSQAEQDSAIRIQAVLRGRKARQEVTRASMEYQAAQKKIAALAIQRQGRRRVSAAEVEQKRTELNDRLRQELRARRKARNLSVQLRRCSIAK